MRRLLGCGALIVILIGAVFFVRGWNRVTTWGTSTGTIARQISERAETAGERVGQAVEETRNSTLRDIARNPLRFEGQRKTVTGRVRSVTKIASNRNLYLLVEGNDRIVVIDDKAPPRAYNVRTVSGVVRTVGPRIAGRNYAYLVDVKSGVKVNPPKLSDIEKFFVGTYDKAKKGVQAVGEELSPS